VEKGLSHKLRDLRLPIKVEVKNRPTMTPKGKGPNLEDHGIFHPDLEGFVHIQQHPLRGGSIDVGQDVAIPAVVTYQDPETKKRRRYEGTIPVDIFNWIPEIREQLYPQLTTDSYISINTVFNRRKFPGAGDYRRINAVWVDCDCSRDTEGLDYLEAAERLFGLQARGVVPPFSLIANTGGGVHAYWLLKGGEDDPNLPPRGYARNVETLSRVNQEIACRVAAACPELQPDSGPAWVTTHQRVAGSINTSTNTEVDYWLAVKDGAELRYTLDYICEFFEVERQPLRYQKRGKGDVRHPAKLKAWEVRWQYTLDEFQLLRTYVESEGGFPGARGKAGMLKAGSTGTRRWACMFLATILRCNLYPKGRIEQEVYALAKACNPPLPRHEARSSFTSATKKKGKFPGHVTIANTLRVTVELADLLGLERIRPDYQAKPVTRTGKEATNREARMSFLLELADKDGVLSYDYDTLVALLKDAGMPTARGTVYNYVKGSGLRTTVVRKRRKGGQAQLIN